MNRKELISKYLRNNKQRVIISALCVWSFLHTFILLRYIRVVEIVLSVNNWSEKETGTPYDMFYPFTSKEYSNGYIHNFDMRFYDFSEYFFYVGGAWMIYYLYRYLSSESISRKSI